MSLLLLFGGGGALLPVAPVLRTSAVGVEILIRQQEGCDPDPFLLWDSVERSIEEGTDFLCDWQLSGASEALNRGGLQAQHALETAVMLALFTDAYVPTDHPLAYLADGDNRGWWGDGIDVRADLNERTLGSYLWLLERAPLTVAGVPIETWAQQFAIAALAPLQQQGAVARIDVQAASLPANSRLELAAQLYGRDGAKVYDRRFDLVWKQVS